MCSHSRPIIGVPDQEVAIIVVTGLSRLLKHLCRFENSSLLCLASQVEEVRDAMENEMRTQLRRQAAAHTDHLRDVLRVQEQELKYEFEQVRTCCKALSPLQPSFPIYVINSLCFHLTFPRPFIWGVEAWSKVSNGTHHGVQGKAELFCHVNIHWFRCVGS